MYELRDVAHCTFCNMRSNIGPLTKILRTPWENCCLGTEEYCLILGHFGKGFMENWLFIPDLDRLPCSPSPPTAEVSLFLFTSVPWFFFCFQNLYTSSPYSDLLSLGMKSAPPSHMEIDSRGDIFREMDGAEVSKVNKAGPAGILWLIGPTVAAALLCVFFVMYFVIKK